MLLAAVLILVAIAHRLEKSVVKWRRLASGNIELRAGAEVIGELIAATD